MVQITELTPETFPSFAERLAALRRETALEVVGHTDFAESPAALVHWFGNRVSREPVLFAALDGEELVGAAAGAFPLRENLHLVDDVEVAVTAPSRRRGIGTALLGALTDAARARGRTHLVGWHASELVAPDAPGAVVSPTSHLAGVPTAGSAFAIAMGFEPGLIERQSTLTVPDSPAPPAPVPGYRIVTWEGPAPAEHLAGLATLFGLFTEDVPNGELDYEVEDWTAERIAEQEAASRYDRVTAIAIHEATGDAVAATGLIQDPEHPEAAMQEATMVLRGHRGHGLGLAVKRANLVSARATWPALERVHTWNAGENDHMWAINEALGFVPRLAEVGWQKVLG